MYKTCVFEDILDTYVDRDVEAKRERHRERSSLSAEPHLNRSAISTCSLTDERATFRFDKLKFLVSWTDSAARCAIGTERKFRITSKH